MSKLIEVLGIIVFSVFFYLIWNLWYENDDTDINITEEYFGSGRKQPDDERLNPIKITVPEKLLDDLRTRLRNTRLTQPLEDSRFWYGTNSNALSQILKYWLNEYDWRAKEKYMNKYPHYTTQIQGLQIHYVHIKPNRTVQNTVPLLLLHGWGTSFFEYYPVVSLLEKNEDFVPEIIIPSLPGFGWSQPPPRLGCGLRQMAAIMKNLMVKLGHSRFYVHGEDWGSQVASFMARYFPKNVIGLHITMCYSNSPKTRKIIFLCSFWPSLCMEDKFITRHYPYWKKYMEFLQEFGYFHLQATKPDTLGIGLNESPAGLASYILEKYSTATNRSNRGREEGGLTTIIPYDRMIDHIMVYWITRTITSSMRIYLESEKTDGWSTRSNNKVYIPTWCARYPSEIVYQPDWILKRRYTNLHVKDMPRGGHYVILEDPKLFTDDLLEALHYFESNRKSL